MNQSGEKLAAFNIFTPSVNFVATFLSEEGIRLPL